ncbi:MAG: efflux transporter outer membrane subunit [Planctomycetes bacterium]|nr:efflux transporter outer membrane subunit [Planctomycetota bacterium]
MNVLTKKLVLILCVIISVTMTGCMLGPDYSRPQTPASTADTYVRPASHNQDVNDFPDIHRWWMRFGDPVTADLVKQALENNYDLKAAAAKVLQAQAVLAEIRGRQLPEINYNLNRSRSKTSFNFGGAGRFNNISTTWAQDVTVSYIFDLFGKLKRAEKASWADMLAAQTNEWALINSLIASVINARVQIATLQNQLDIAHADTESRNKTQQIVERRYSTGLVGPVDVRLARENLAAAKAAEITIQLTLIKARNALDVLLAKPPGSSPILPATLAQLPNLDPVTIGLPASLLDRRPDVRSAELALESSSEKIGVSIAQMYPDLILSAGVGRSADRWRDIWKGETEIYSAIFRLAQPIFKGGQLKAQVDAAKARYSELAANYAKTILTAMQEVEDALISEQLLQERLKYVKVRFEQARAAENLSIQRYQRGVEGILTVLESERRRRIAENDLAILKGRIWTNRVNLFLALGGDWIGPEENSEKQDI